MVCWHIVHGYDETLVTQRARVLHAAVGRRILRTVAQVWAVCVLHRPLAVSGACESGAIAEFEVGKMVCQVIAVVSGRGVVPSRHYNGAQ